MLNSGESTAKQVCSQSRIFFIANEANIIFIGHCISSGGFIWIFMKDIKKYAGSCAQEVIQERKGNNNLCNITPATTCLHKSGIVSQKKNFYAVM